MKWKKWTGFISYSSISSLVLVMLLNIFIILTAIMVRIRNVNWVTSVCTVVNNLYVRFNCDCWDSLICVHGSSGATVIIGNRESACPVGSPIDNPNSSKTLKVCLYCELSYFLYSFLKFIASYILYIQLHTVLALFFTG